MPRRPPDHERDAGGDRSVLAAKSALRREVWRALSVAKVSRFPGAEGRIPNFIGAEQAAERLRTTRPWSAAATVKANPDSPQLPVRQRALQDGKLLYVAVPRLATERPFLMLDPAVIEVSYRQAASIGGSSKHGRAMEMTSLQPFDLVIAGCVAVSADGSRLGKGGGYSDLEYALAREAGLIGPSTVLASTVHDVQVLDDGRIPMTDHDFRLDLIITPTRTIQCRRSSHKPKIYWQELTDEKIASIPILANLRRCASSDG